MFLSLQKVLQKTFSVSKEPQGHKMRNTVNDHHIRLNISSKRMKKETIKNVQDS